MGYTTHENELNTNQIVFRHEPTGICVAANAVDISSPEASSDELTVVFHYTTESAFSTILAYESEMTVVRATLMGQMGGSGIVDAFFGERLSTWLELSCV